MEETLDILKYIQDTFGICQVEKEYVYHYTTAEGLKGIIDNGFWVTERNFLNDKMEFKIAEDLCFEYWDKTIRDKSLLRRIKDGFSKYFRQLNSLFDENLAYDGIYVLSLSEKKDNNLLWSNYTENEGFCIAFDAKAFCNNPDSKPLITGKVIYDKDKQQDLIKKGLEEFILHEAYHMTEWDKMLKFDDKEFEKFCFDGSLICNLYNMFFKSECFRGEEEYRVVFLSAEDSDNLKLGKPSYRIRNGVIVPYYEYKQSNLKEIIKEIWIGPKSNKELISKSLTFFLKDRGLKAKIIPSPIPLIW